MTPRIMKQPPAPGTDEWRGMITASKIPAILKLSRWQSEYSLWHEMKGLYTRESPNETRMAMGHLAEDFLAKAWQYKRRQEQGHHYQLNQFDRYRQTYELTYTNPDLPFPNLATIDRRGINRKQSGDGRFWIIEAKTASDLRDWGEPGDPNGVPPDYLAQVMFQMGVSGVHNASIVAVDYNFKPEIWDIGFNSTVFDHMVKKASAFYETLSQDDPPELDDSVATYETVRGIHPDIDKGSKIEISLELASKYLDAVHAAEVAEANLRGAKIQLLSEMGTTNIATCDTGTDKPVKIADRRPGRGGSISLYANKKAQL
ncbi:MAG: YqaJ viral recombinase family protein [Yaniella sp.]|nr:YqaJ viral recombinase family protein [Corynebacterium casei]MDN6286087.1 YqaJ viral recombinase family protein [Corynebacterium casei]MDN6424200.1 YqaJ viral recombinase family protein [Bifidobacterium crudilactis]MDN6489400.1 YqaJ viral recombinase family protein [Yaniella sp.]